MRVDRDLHVKLCYKGSPLPLPQWFRHGRDCRLTRKSINAKLPKLYQIRGGANVQYSRRAQRAQIQEKRIFLSNVIRYSLYLHYTSLQTYQLLVK